jgi:hypothetical protein
LTAVLFLCAAGLSLAQEQIKPFSYDYPEQLGLEQLKATDASKKLLNDGIVQPDGAGTVWGRWMERDFIVDWAFDQPVRISQIKLAITHPDENSDGSHPGEILLYGSDGKAEFLGEDEPDYVVKVSFKKGKVQEIVLSLEKADLIVKKLRTNFKAAKNQTALTEVTFLGKPVSGEDMAKAQAKREKIKLPEFKQVEFLPMEFGGKVNAENSIFGVCAHMLHTDVFFPKTGKDSFSSYWKPEYVIPWMVRGNFGWVREPLYGFFQDQDGKLIPEKTAIIDRYLTMYDQIGIKVLLCPMFGMPDKNSEIYLTWVGQLAKKHPCVKLIELHNEPNLKGFWPNSAKDYVTACKAAYKIFKKEVPNIPVAAGAFSGWGHVWDYPEIKDKCKDKREINLSFLQTCLEAGMLDACDVVSAHPYQQVAPESGFQWEETTDPKGYEKEILYVWDFIQKYNKTNKPLRMYFTEIGYSSASVGFNSVGNVDRQADYLSRLMLLLFNLRLEGYPLDGIFWYDLKCDDERVGEYEANFGIVANDTSSARPGYDYYRQITTFFADTNKYSPAKLNVTFNNWPEVIKSFAWKKTDGSLVVAFWRMNQLQSRDMDFAAMMSIGEMPGKVNEVILYDLESGSPRSIGFKQEGNTLNVPVRLFDRASWIEVKFAQ